MKYTKGEWKTGKSPLGDWFVTNGETLIARYIRHWDVQLIASAPVLYEALRNVHESASFIRLPSLLREMVSKAIAKAEGSK